MQEQAAELARRRQQIAAAAGPAVAPGPPGVAAMASAVMVPGEALKAADPDITKPGKLWKKDGNRAGRDLSDENRPASAEDGDADAATDAHDAALGWRAAMAEDAGKAYADRGIRQGPAEPVMPGRVEPEHFGRP
jgi:hypothetical protein